MGEVTKMKFDPENNVIKRCAQGMSLEGEGKNEEALKLFQQAWYEASNDFEKFIAAHYVARHQQHVRDKLKWDETALQSALEIPDESMKQYYPSLYLNIARCHEELNDFDSAITNYLAALEFTSFLGDDGYGKLIKSGIANGIDRIQSGSKFM